MNSPAAPSSYNLNLALSRVNALIGGGDFAQARTICQQAYELFPDNTDILNAYAICMMELDNEDVAEGMLKKALSLDAAKPQTHNNLGLLALRQKDDELAEKRFREALANDENSLFALQNYVHLLLKHSKTREVYPYMKKLFQLNPNLPKNLWQQYTAIVYQQGTDEESAQIYQQIAARYPDDPVVQIIAAAHLPRIPESREQIRQAREQFSERLDALIQKAATNPAFRLKTDILTEVTVHHFFLSYQGEDNRELLEKLAKAYRSICPSLNISAPHCRKKRDPNAPLKIGFYSSLMFDHSVGRCFVGALEAFSRAENTELYLFTNSKIEGDAYHERAVRACRETIYQDPFAKLSELSEQIAARELDVLIFTDGPMNSQTYFLMFQRLARTQVTVSGHPDTTGIDTVDYYCAIKDLQSGDMRDYYTETFVPLEHMMFTSELPAVKNLARSRKDFGLPESGPLLLCPMMPQKLHPDMDEILLRTLESLPDAHIVLFRTHESDTMHLVIKERLDQKLGELGKRIIWMPFLPQDEFFALLKLTDVLLDTPHFGGGTTSMYALALGLPVVTLPGKFERSRVTLLCYRLVCEGEAECVASDMDDYVDKVQQLASNRELRENLSQRILAKGKDWLKPEYDGLVDSILSLREKI